MMRNLVCTHFLMMCNLVIRNLGRECEDDGGAVMVARNLGGARNLAARNLGGAQQNDQRSVG